MVDRNGARGAMNQGWGCSVHKTSHERRATSDGFTLIEMMIVIVVIAILLGVLLPQFRGTQDEAAINRAKSELRTIATAIESYYIHNSNTLPTNLTALITATPRIITGRWPT